MSAHVNHPILIQPADLLRVQNLKLHVDECADVCQISLSTCHECTEPGLTTGWNMLKLRFAKQRQPELSIARNLVLKRSVKPWCCPPDGDCAWLHLKLLVHVVVGISWLSMLGFASASKSTTPICVMEALTYISPIPCWHDTITTLRAHAETWSCKVPIKKMNPNKHRQCQFTAGSNVSKVAKHISFRAKVITHNFLVTINDHKWSV